ncbi:TrmH family RNA methyltransferase [Clostridium estertheticum]|uniref:RNA methyltransferase n=1 Tax=Clostridium estertheticum subsp. estertheticum TaxID=1552 RepID=A0A1J0GK41_9CLOT|nr:RNA methyltransferase [Clostridium estertheticum]APC41725.1 RNA methyltransferase [Clostridium estertheticum subsp. estertheticum]MBU3073440.1 RNA methyltransferase [Clostridium estertheticum]MBU3163319.1 RNA methyltransferase [Clostridium estertheticum]MBZ9616392.1 RNA methyltransferase [Clostridium estertheticum subsp. laramiense]WAG72126.1 RNA methyltransferase [Clostridium estertheticum]
MEYIQSKDNLLIKDIRKLKEKRYRVSSNMFLVEGFRFVEEALDSGFEVVHIFISARGEVKFENSSMKNKLQVNTKVYGVSDSLFKNICDTDNPQGIIASVRNKPVEIKYDNGFYMLADRIQDPGNMGTIIRTAHAAGALGVILTKGTVDIYNEKTLRATMGSIFKIPIIYDNDLSLVKKLKKSGFKLVTSSLDTDKNFYDIDLKGKIIISVGNEGNGISDEVYEICDLKIKIPMPGGAESLNVAVASSIMMYEVVRQKNII